MHFFTVTAIEPALRLRLEVKSSPILLASSALVDGCVVRTEHLPGAIDTGGTLPAGSKVSVAVGIEVVSVRGAGALEMTRSECESVSTAVECSKPGEGVTFSTGVLETGGTECELVVTEPGKGVAEMRMTGRLSPVSAGGSQRDLDKDDRTAFKRGLQMRGGVDESFTIELFWPCMGDLIDDPVIAGGVFMTGGVMARGEFVTGGIGVCMFWICHHSPCGPSLPSGRSVARNASISVLQTGKLGSIKDSTGTVVHVLFWGFGDVKSGGAGGCGSGIVIGDSMGTGIGGSSGS
ncbi:hypothetical protein BDR05DRAFT_945870 [Suillus weaverae]|nr:hypothetical protein BDR05DRAFT_945870 [Suillus weaverae]